MSKPLAEQILERMEAQDTEDDTDSVGAFQDTLSVIDRKSTAEQAKLFRSLALTMAKEMEKSSGGKAKVVKTAKDFKKVVQGRV